MTQVTDPLVETLADDLILTTTDNPYNPHQEYLKWRQWDEESGYHTEAYLARIANIPPTVDDDDDVTISELTNKAIEEILINDLIGTYTLV